MTFLKPQFSWSVLGIMSKGMPPKNDVDAKYDGPGRDNSLVCDQVNKPKPLYTRMSHAYMASYSVNTWPKNISSNGQMDEKIDEYRSELKY